jgi:hypothetical protein
MRSVVQSMFVAGLIAGQSATCWAIGPMGFSDPPPTPPASQGHPVQQQIVSQGQPQPSASSMPMGDWATTSADESTFDSATSDDYGSCPSCGGCGKSGCRSCCGHGFGSCITSGIFCNMPQHMPYPTPWNRYYYFRPYQYFQVTQLQETVAGWGQDPRNISDNSFFEKIYEEVGAPANPNEYQRPATPKPEPVPPPKPAPAKSDEQGMNGPGFGQRPLKFTQQAEPKRAVRKATRPKTSKPNPEAARAPAQTDDRKVTAPASSEAPFKFTLRAEPKAILPITSSAELPAAAAIPVRAPQSDVGDGKNVELIRFVVP